MSDWHEHEFEQNFNLWYTPGPKCKYCGMTGLYWVKKFRENGTFGWRLVNKQDNNHVCSKHPSQRVLLEV